MMVRRRPPGPRIHRPWWTALALALGLATAVPTAAAAPTSPKVGVLPSGVEGDLPEDWAASLRERMQEGLRRGRFTIVDAASQPSAKTCRAADCRASIARALDAGYLARLDVRKDQSDYAIRIELFGPDGSSLLVAEESCEVCGIEEVRTVVADQAALVRSKLEALSRGRPELRFVTRPTAAKLFVDGRMLGTTPVVREVDAGRHRVKAEARGYVPLEREVTAVAGTRETVVLEMQAVPRSQRFLPWGVGTLIVGSIAVVAGATLVTIHERPFGSVCTGNDVDADGDCRLVYDTLGGGAALTAAGGAALIVGGVLVGLAVRDRKASERRVQASAGSVTVKF